MMSAFLNVIAHLVVGIFGAILVLVGLGLTYMLVLIIIDDIEEHVKRKNKK